MTIDLFDPTTTADKTPIEYVPRPRTLNGLKVGLVDNAKYNSKTLLLKIAERMKAKYDVDMAHAVTKASAGHAVSDAAVGDFKRTVDFVVAGIGDWGSCSSGSVLDGILLEKAGVPSVSIVTEPFRVTGQEMAKSWGVPDYRFLDMPHPIANLSDDALDRQADELLERVVALITEPMWE